MLASSHLLTSLPRPLPLPLPLPLSVPRFPRFPFPRFPFFFSASVERTTFTISPVLTTNERARRRFHYNRHSNLPLANNRLSTRQELFQ